jgi:trehalose synthase
MQNLEKYRKIVGDKVINEIYRKAKKLANKHIICISSTHQGGGVAEMLNSIVFLFDEVGIDFGWRIIHGSPDFFSITKQFHNALQSGKMHLTDRKKEMYLQTIRRFSAFMHLNHDLVIVHDPQPLALIEFYKKKQPWIWRCHIDLSNPNKEVWNFLKPFIKKYDHIVISAKEYKKNLPVPQSIIYPAIDPCSPKNKTLLNNHIDKRLAKLGINTNKPIIAQISRFDKWKDPEGVIKIFDLVKQKVDCQLVLLGNLAMDDPEGVIIYNKIMKKYGRRRDINILVNVSDNDLVVNSLQRKSTVIIQKSTKEGFGLTVTEALYKGTPVVASNIGGLPLQVIDGVNGFLHDPKDFKGFSESIIKILNNSELRNKLGQNGQEYVIKNFLITRLMIDWLNLMSGYLK